MGRKGKNKQDKTTLLEENINRFSLPDKQIFETKANENREIFDNPKERKIAIGLSKRLIRSQTTSKWNMTQRPQNSISKPFIKSYAKWRGR